MHSFVLFGGCTTTSIQYMSAQGKSGGNHLSAFNHRMAFGALSIAFLAQQ